MQVLTLQLVMSSSSLPGWSAPYLNEHNVQAQSYYFHTLLEDHQYKT
jgi:hypothetical protein